MVFTLDHAYVYSAPSKRKDDVGGRGITPNHSGKDVQTLVKQATMDRARPATVLISLFEG